MQVTEEHAELLVTFEITDGEDMPGPAGGRTFNPDRVHVAFYNDRLQNVKVSGPVRKVNGDLGTLREAVDYGPRDTGAWAEWVEDLVQRAGRHVPQPRVPSIEREAYEEAFEEKMNRQMAGEEEW